MQDDAALLCPYCGTGLALTSTPSNTSIEDLYKVKKHGDNHESQIWLVMKYPMLITAFAFLFYMLFGSIWIIGSGIGIAIVVLSAILIAVHNDRARKGTQEERAEKELAKKKHI